MGPGFAALCAAVLWLSSYGAHAPANPWPMAPPWEAVRALGDPAYLPELIARAEALRLWERRDWRVLLHYREDWLGGVTSEADGLGFFLSLRGKTDPRAELEATLAGFFSEAILEPGKQSAQCTFIARRAWLDEQLGFDWSRLSRDPCERFQAWRRSLDPASVTLIYASYYFNNPSSMFGHTLLRLDKRGRGEEQRLLDYSVTYGAVVPEDANGLFWAINGVFGGYNGYFSIVPYYIKVREYNDFEDRDLWEYRLALAPEEIERLLRHAWEMGSTHFDYFFFRENCSYHLLALIEAARPEARLREHFPLYTLPTSTIAQVLAQPGLVAEVTYRPARGRQLRWKMSGLSSAEQALVYALAEDPARVEEPAFQALPVPTKALVLEGATDIHQLRLAAEGEDSPRRAEMRRLLLARSRLGYRRPDPGEPPRPPAPEEGHASSRLFVGGGGDNAERSFYELLLQPAFHDLLAKEDGYAPNSQIVALALRLRYEPDVEKLRVERADLVDIVSLFPVSRLARQFSWKVRAGWERSRDLGCAACAPFVLDGGIGLAAESHALTREVFYLFLEPTLQVDGILENGWRGGAGGSAGLLLDITGDWRLWLEARQTVFFAGVDEPTVVEKAALRQRYSLSRNLDLRLDWSGAEGYREVSAGLSWYF